MAAVGGGERLTDAPPSTGGVRRTGGVRGGSAERLTDAPPSMVPAASWRAHVDWGEQRRRTRRVRLDESSVWRVEVGRDTPSWRRGHARRGHAERGIGDDGEPAGRLDADASGTGARQGAGIGDAGADQRMAWHLARARCHVKQVRRVRGIQGGRRGPRHAPASPTPAGGADLILL